MLLRARARGTTDPELDALTDEMDVVWDAMSDEERGCADARAEAAGRPGEVRAEVRQLYRWGAGSLSDFEPAVSDDFAFLLQIMVGRVGADGEDSFNVVVVTPKHLSRMAAPGPISGRHMLIVTRFDAVAISNWVTTAVGSCSGNTWSEVAEKLARIGHWEFEDYTP